MHPLVNSPTRMKKRINHHTSAIWTQREVSPWQRLWSKEELSICFCVQGATAITSFPHGESLIETAVFVRTQPPLLLLPVQVTKASWVTQPYNKNHFYRIQLHWIWQWAQMCKWFHHWQYKLERRGSETIVVSLPRFATNRSHFHKGNLLYSRTGLCWIPWHRGWLWESGWASSHC